MFSRTETYTVIDNTYLKTKDKLCVFFSISLNTQQIDSSIFGMKFYFVFLFSCVWKS